MPRQEDVVGHGEGDPVRERLVLGDRLRGLEALAISAARISAETMSRQPAHLRVTGDLFRIDVDQLDHPVGVAAAGGGDEVGDRLAAIFTG